MKNRLEAAKDLLRDDGSVWVNIDDNEIAYLTILMDQVFDRAIPFQGIAKEGGVVLKKGKKPESLLRRIFEIGSDEGDLILDFHLGTGTAAAVAHKTKRQYIGIEQLDYGDNDSIVRLRNVIKGDQSGISKIFKWHGGGEFIACELMKYNEAFMDRIETAKTSKECR
jgi:adenine-specific DNA-methyltransferase